MYLVEFYYKLVKAGRLTIDEVPIKFRERVQERLESDKRMRHIQWQFGWSYWSRRKAERRITVKLSKIYNIMIIMVFIFTILLFLYFLLAFYLSLCILTGSWIKLFINKKGKKITWMYRTLYN